jgi:hypothetical protein
VIATGGVVSSFVVEYDHREHDTATSKWIIRHYVLRPTAFRSEAESTVKNLKLNKQVSKVVIREQRES